MRQRSSSGTASLWCVSRTVWIIWYS